MKNLGRAFLVWLGVMGLLAGTLEFFPHSEVLPIGFASYSILLFGFIACIFIVRHEPVRANKFIFFNFLVFFSQSILYHAYPFLDTVLFNEMRFAKFYFTQYVSLSGHFLLLGLAIVYLTIDLMFRSIRVYQKYLIAGIIVIGFFVYYFHPFISDPLYLYKTEEVQAWKSLEVAFDNHEQAFGTQPSVEELSQIMKTDASMPSSVNVTAIYPYLLGSNYLALLLRPLYSADIMMCVVSLFFILLFFGYQFVKDPPQGAYVEKIMFLFLLLCTVEIYNAWSFLHIVEDSMLRNFIIVGQYVSMAILAMIVFFCGLRLRFITSPKGEFYEQEIAARPSGITRWRDSVDNFVIAKFFESNTILGRMLVDPQRRR